MVRNIKRPTNEQRIVNYLLRLTATGILILLSLTASSLAENNSDLTVSLVTDKTQYYFDDPIKVNFNVTNQGIEPAEFTQNALLAFYDNPSIPLNPATDLNYWFGPGQILEAGQSTIMDGALQPVLGENKLYAWIDPLNEIKEANENNNQTGPYIINVIRKPFKRPTAAIEQISPDYASLSQGIKLTLSGKAQAFQNISIEENKIVEYAWHSSIDGHLSNKRSFSKIDWSIGTHRITFKVKDSYGLWSKESARIVKFTPVSLGFGIIFAYKKTSTSLSASPKKVKKGKPVVLKGRIKKKPIKVKAINMSMEKWPVKIFANGKRIKTVYSNKKGYFTYKYFPKAKATYTYQAKFKAYGDGYGSESKKIQVVVN